MSDSPIKKLDYAPNDKILATLDERGRITLFDIQSNYQPFKTIDCKSSLFDNII